MSEAQRIIADNPEAALLHLAGRLRREELVPDSIVVGGTRFETKFFLEQAARTMLGDAPVRLTGEIGIDDGSLKSAIISLEGRLKQRGLLT